MATQAGPEAVKAVFASERPEMMKLAARFVDDPDAVLDEASELFDSMIPGMAYVDDPTRPMAGAVFACSAILSVYLALAKRGVDVHDFGSAYLEGLARMLAQNASTAETAEPDPEERRRRRRAFVAAAEASQRDARPGEFVFELVSDPGPDVTWGMNIKSCGICYQFSKHDALDLVPYMCASDDVMSDQANSGLRRTGTIALGAHQCDFRYKDGGEPRRVAEQYPERIQIGRRPKA